MDQLFDQLPPFDSFVQSFHYDILNWLPLYWRGFKQTTKYTYVIEDLSDMNAVVARFNTSKQRQLRKHKTDIKIVHDLGLEKFYAINESIFNAQGLSAYYPFELVKKIDDACKVHHCRKIFFAVDAQENVLAINYAVWDNSSLYVIMGGSNPEFKSNFAGTIIEYATMKFASEMHLKFDFEGSMISGVEEYNRSLGGVQKPYLLISKVTSPLVKIKRFIGSLFS
jgi:hypothetical protein